MKYNNKLKLAIKINKYDSFKDFARSIGYDRSFISKICTGSIKPTLEQAQKITSKLNVSIFDLFEFKDIRDYEFKIKKCRKDGLSTL